MPIRNGPLGRCRDGLEVVEPAIDVGAAFGTLAPVQEATPTDATRATTARHAPRRRGIGLVVACTAAV
jgi:hypothetical protein